MPYADPEKKKAWEREKRRRDREKVLHKSNLTDLPEIDPKTPQGIMDLLAESIQDVRRADADIFMKARTIARLADTSLKAIEIVDLAARIEALENTGGEKRYYGF